MNARELFTKLNRLDDERGHLDFEITLEVSASNTNIVRADLESIRVEGDTIILSNSED